MDARVVTALFNQNIKQFLSKDRLAKIIASMKFGKDRGALSEGLVAPTAGSQTVGIGTYATFLFEDATYPGGVRFWLGKIAQMAIIPTSTSGKKSLVLQRISIVDMPANLHFMCNWMEPNVPAQHLDDKHFALHCAEYRFCDIKQNMQYVQSKYIINAVVLVQSPISNNIHLLDSDDIDVVNEYVTSQHQQPCPPEPVVITPRPQPRGKLLITFQFISFTNVLCVYVRRRT